MKYLFVLLFVFIITCAYPDIDSVPDFSDLVITEEDSIELCKLSYTDKLEVIKCLVSYYESLETNE